MAFAQVPQDRTVRVIYMVSKDRHVRADFQQAVEAAIRELQPWYARQLNGPTFKLHDPVVEVIHSSRKAAWFNAHPTGPDKDDWGFTNTFTEAHRLLGVRYNDPHYVWVIYSDGPGHNGRGAPGVACLPEEDLLGLIGQNPRERRISRWVGGLGHELGHAFGLLHPADSNLNADAIMGMGYYDKYPDKAILTEADKHTLLHSPFFFDAAGRPVSGASR